MAEIGAQEVLAALRRIEDRGAVESAHRCRVIISQVFRFAIASGLADRDPAHDCRGAMTPVQSNKMAAITNPAEVAALMRNITSYKGSLVTRVALQLSSLLAVRPGELRKAEWSEINWIKKEWLMRLAFADIRKLFTEDGRFFPYLMGGL